MNNRKIGSIKEELCVNYLKDKGYCVVERNFYCRQGEIDIIALDNRCLVFVEVKFRKSLRAGSSLEAITNDKIKKISKTAEYYIYTHRQFNKYSMRFDVIGIDGENIEHIENAFFYMGGCN